MASKLDTFVADCRAALNIAARHCGAGKST